MPEGPEVRKVVDFLSRFELLIWNLVWIIIIFVSLRPKVIDEYFTVVHKIDIFYIITILSIIFLLIFSYFNMLKIKIIEKKINTIIRAEALQKIINKIKK